MTQSHRLDDGGRIDRNRPLTFRFDGEQYQGFTGDTLASALLANGVRVVNRSAKLHRPRGIVGRGSEEPSAILQIGRGPSTLPNQRATQTELYDGLDARPIVGATRRDPRAALDAFSALMPAGFYYKTFMAPHGAWRHYERVIRRAAGSGLAPNGPDPDVYDRINAHCDVLVAGGGPAGLMAALAAARSGARVILAHEQAEFGGGLLHNAADIDGAPGARWVAAVVAELAGFPEVTLLSRTQVFGHYDYGFLGLAQRLTDHLPPDARRGPRERYWRVRARQVVLAAGAIERPIVFADNDRPGVMTASAVTTYLRRYAVAPGQRAVVYTNNDTAYACAMALGESGVTATVADARVDPGPVAAAAAERGVDVRTGTVVSAVRGGRGVEGAVLSDPDGRQLQQVPCDLVAVSGGWNPAVHLHSHVRGALDFDRAHAMFVPGEGPGHVRSAGACRGTFDLAACLAEGAAAGASAARDAGFSAGVLPTPEVANADPGPGSMRILWRSPAPSGRHRPAFVDLQNDVKVDDLALALREGYRAMEHVKRYSVLGFGTDQGRLGNIVGAGIVAEMRGEDLGEIGTTTFRPAWTPVTFGTLVAEEQRELFDPVRVTPMHDWHVDRGACFEDVGQWKRARYYPRDGEDMDAAVRRECLAAHRGVGVLDYSTLGKIDIQGPDAVELLNRVYTNHWSSLKVGRCRYGLMLDDNGIVLDDGVTARLGERHYLMSTTTGGAARVLAWLERWLQTEWPDLQVYLTSVTDHWVTISLAGPHSRDLVHDIGTDIDLSPEAFPFMAIREGHIAGVEGRIQRVSFSGEQTFELSVPADYGAWLWERIMALGERYGATPYGTETMHVLRAEKGFIIVGQDTDGSVTPLDLGMGGLVSRKKDCLGKRALSRPEMQRNDRPQLVGLLPDDRRRVIPEGAQLITERGEPPLPTAGWVTSSYFGARIDRSFALAMLNGGRQRHGDRVFAWDLDAGMIPATITRPVFQDD